MIKEALNNLFSPAAPASIVATVRRRIRADRYELTDDAGRLLQADSSAFWSPGARVTVTSGRIVAAAGRINAIKTYEV